MQIVFIGGNLIKCRNLVVGKIKKKYFNMSSAENFTQSANYQAVSIYNSTLFLTCTQEINNIWINRFLVKLGLCRQWKSR